MKTIMIQVDEKYYDEFVAALNKKQFSWKKLNDFTPVGRWCIIQVDVASWEEADEIETIYESL